MNATSDGESAADWPQRSAEDAGFAPGLGEGLDWAFAEGNLSGLHGVVVVREGHLVLERYYAGEDWRWGEALGWRDFDAAALHDLRSVTKSIVSLLYGIALDEELVPPPEAVLVTQFPEYADLIADPARRRMTVGHALSMKLGTEWDEDLPYSDPKNSEIAMEMAADRYRFVLDRPFVAEPGDWWIYNGGTTALLARLIERGSGRSLKDWAEERLLRPLGIAAFDWIQGADGTYSAASGLRLRPRDLARVGQLVLDGGWWEGRRVVPADWLRESFVARAHLQSGLRYGYQWWLGSLKNGADWMAGFGNGGQRLFLLPDKALVVAVTAGRYNHPDAWQIPAGVVADHVLPALYAAEGSA